MPTGTAMRLLKAARLWIEKMWYIYTTEYYSAVKKNDIMPFAVKWMNLMGLEMIMYLPDDSVVKNPPAVLKTRV